MEPTTQDPAAQPQEQKPKRLPSIVPQKQDTALDDSAPESQPAQDPSLSVTQSLNAETMPKPGFDIRDIPVGAAAGVMNAAKNTYNLIPMVTGGAVPKWNDAFIPTTYSKTGDFITTGVDFVATFLPVSGLIGKTGKIGEAMGLVKKTAEGASAVGAEANAINKFGVIRSGRAALTKTGTMAASSASAFVGMDPMMAQFSNFPGISQLLDMGPASWKQTVAEVMDAKEESPELLNRFRSAAQDIGFGFAADALFRAIVGLGGYTRDALKGSVPKDYQEVSMARAARIQEALAKAETQRRNTELVESWSDFRDAMRELESQHEEAFAFSKGQESVQGGVAKLKSQAEGLAKTTENAPVYAGPPAVDEEAMREVRKYLEDVAGEAQPTGVEARFPTQTKLFGDKDLLSKFQSLYEERMANRAAEQISGIGVEDAAAGKVNPKKLSAFNLTTAMLRDKQLNARMWEGGRPLVEYVRTLEQLVDETFGKTTEKVLLDDTQVEGLAAALNTSTDALRRRYFGTAGEVMERSIADITAKEALLTGHAQYMASLLDEAAKSGEPWRLLVAEEEMFAHAALLKYVKEGRSAWGYGGQELGQKVLPGSTEAFDKLKGTLTRYEASRLEQQLKVEEATINKRAKEAFNYWMDVSKSDIRAREADYSQRLGAFLKGVKSDTAAAYETWKDLRKEVIGNPVGPQGKLVATIDGIFSKTRFDSGDAALLSKIAGDPNTAEQLMLMMGNRVSAKAIRGDLKEISSRVQLRGGLSALQDRVKFAAAALNHTDEAALAEAAANMMDDMVRPSVGKQLMEWWVNDILWGGRTLARVAISEAMLGMIVKPALRISSGLTGATTSALLGNPENAKHFLNVAKTGVGQLVLQTHPSFWKEAWKATQKAWQEREGQLIRPYMEAGQVSGREMLTNSNLRFSLRNSGDLFDPDKSVLGSAMLWLFTKEEGAPWIRGGLDLGGISRQSGRALVSVDELIKQVVARTAAQSRLAVEEAAKYPLNPSLAASQAAQRFQNIIRGNQLMTKDALAREAYEKTNDFGFRMANGITNESQRRKWIDAYVQDQWVTRSSDSAVVDWVEGLANEAAGTTPLDPETSLGYLGSRIISLKASHPAWGLLFPFVQTPVNMMAYTWNSTIGAASGIAQIMAGTKLAGPMMEQRRNALIRGLSSPDPYVRADTMGRMNMAFIMLGGAAHVADMTDDKGRPVVTGAIPASPKLKAMWRQQNIRPYSILIGDEYYSYDGFDPLSMTFGFIVDMTQLNRYSTQADDLGMAEASVAAVTTLASNFISRTYMRGMFDMVQAIASREGSKAKNILSSFTVNAIPGPVQVGMEIGRSFTDDGYRREIASVADSVKRRMGLSEGLPYAWNILGEKVPEHEFWGPDWVSPIGYAKTSSDALSTEFRKIGLQGDGVPSDYKGMDLTKLKMPDGRSFHDHWGEETGKVQLGGKNIRAFLEDVMKSDFYKNMSPDPDPVMKLDSKRLTYVRNIVKVFREMAFAELRSRLPQIGGVDPITAWDIQRSQKQVNMLTGAQTEGR